MADWATVRNDPTYVEPLDAELIPLLDALNDAGLATVASCSRHGTGWPFIAFAAGNEARFESLARFILPHEQADYQASFCQFHRVVAPDGYEYSLKIHLNNVYADTPTSAVLAEAVTAINRVAALVIDWANAARSVLPPDREPANG